MRPTACFNRAHVCLACGDDTGKCGCESEDFCHSCLQPVETCPCLDDIVRDHTEWDLAEEGRTEEACPYCGSNHIHSWNDCRDSEGSCFDDDDIELSQPLEDEGPDDSEGSCFDDDDFHDTSAFIDTVCGGCGKHPDFCNCLDDDYTCCCYNYPCTCGDI